MFYIIFLVISVVLIVLSSIFGMQSNWLECIKVCFLVFVFAVEIVRIIKNKEPIFKYIYFLVMILHGQDAWLITTVATMCMMIELFLYFSQFYIAKKK